LKPSIPAAAEGLEGRRRKIRAMLPRPRRTEVNPTGANWKKGRKTP